jgi:hypothetical protein
VNSTRDVDLISLFDVVHELVVADRVMYYQVRGNSEYVTCDNIGNVVATEDWMPERRDMIPFTRNHA